MTTDAPPSAPATLRLHVESDDRWAGGRQVQVFVDDVEMTSRGAGLGMEPFDLLVPDNRLRAERVPHRVPVARCSCGEYGCGSTDVTITRMGDVVRWDWSIEVPLPHGVVFAADQYDAEMARIEADHSWETPEDTASRLILTGVDRAALAAHGLRLSRASVDHQDNSRFMASLTTSDERYQVIVEVLGGQRSSVDIAEDMLAALNKPPVLWEATFFSPYPLDRGRPTMAGPRWQRLTMR